MEEKVAEGVLSSAQAPGDQPVKFGKHLERYPLGC
jgi:hypothetical protein